MTQSGHWSIPYRVSFKWLRWLFLSLGAGNETARVHHASLRRGNVAVRRARAGERADAPYRRAPNRNRGRSGNAGPHRGISSGPAAIGLDYRPQRANRHPLGHDRCRRDSQARGGIGRARARRHPGPCRHDRGAVAAGDPHRADRVPGRRRSGRGRLRRQPGAAGRQRHRFHELRIQPERQMAGTAQTDRAGA